MSSNDSAKDFITDADDLLQTFEFLKLECVDIQNEWDLYVLPNNSTEDVRKIFTEDVQKMDCAKKQCFVFGSAGSGKSTLINALIGCDVSPNGNNRMISDLEEPDQKGNINDVYDEVTLPLSPNRNTEGSVIGGDAEIKAFAPVKHCRLMENDIDIIESCGIEGSVEDKDLIQKEGIGTVLVLVVSSVFGFGDTERNFLTTHKAILSTLMILVVFNSWDKINKPKRKGFKTKNVEAVNDFFVNVFGLTRATDDEGIFFLSAKDQLKMQSAKSRGQSPDSEQKNESWEEFLNSLNEYLRKVSERNRLEFQGKTHRMLTTVFNDLRLYIFDIRNRIKKKNRNTLNKLCDFNARINEEICHYFDSHYETFFQMGKKASKLDNRDNKTFDGDYLKAFLEECCGVIIRSLKNTVQNLVQSQYSEYDEYMMKILTTTYFPYYFDVIAKVPESEVSMLRENYLCIIKIISKYRIITIIGSVFGCGALLAVCGAAAGAAAPIAAVIAIPAFAGVGSVLGGGFGGFVSHTANKVKVIKRAAYRPNYKSEEERLQSWWNNVKGKLIDSYESFLSDLPLREQIITSAIEDNLRTSKRSMSRFEKKWEEMNKEEVKTQ